MTNFQHRVVVFSSKYDTSKRVSDIDVVETERLLGKCPFETAVEELEVSTGTAYDSRTTTVCTGLPFSWHGETIYPYLFMLDKSTPTPPSDFLKSLRQDRSSPFFKAFSRCDIPSPLSAALSKLKSDHKSGAGQLCNVAVEDFAALLGEDKALLSIRCPDEWWVRVRLYAWHIARNGRPSMGAVIITCIVRVLETLAACMYMLGPKSPLARAYISKQIVLGCISATRKRWSSIPTYFEDFVGANYFQRTRPLTILLHSCSSVIASSLANLFTERCRPPIKLLVLESRPKFEGVAFARALNAKINACPDTPPVTIEIATDSSVSFFSKRADLYLLAADRIYPNGDVSNKIGCLSAALSIRHHGTGKTVVVSTTDKVCGADERGTGFEENDDDEVTSAWGEKNEFAVTRNVYFETVPNELIDVYLTEKGPVDLLDIKDVSEVQSLREMAAFEGI